MRPPPSGATARNRPAGTARRAATAASSLAAIADRLPFVQFELAGTVGLEQGRYLAGRGSPDGVERVLVVTVDGAPPPPRRRLGRPKPRAAQPGAGPATVPLTTLTVIRPEPLADEDAAQGWLAALGRDPDLIEAELGPALALVNLAVHVHRATVLDPNLPDVSAEHALAIRVGFGDGDELADGRYSAAIELPPRRAVGAEVMRPQERLAAVLAGANGSPSSSCPCCARSRLRRRPHPRGRAGAWGRARGVVGRPSRGRRPGAGAGPRRARGAREAPAAGSGEALEGELTAERAVELGGDPGNRRAGPAPPCGGARPRARAKCQVRTRPVLLRGLIGRLHRRGGRQPAWLLDYEGSFEGAGAEPGPTSRGRRLRALL